MISKFDLIYKEIVEIVAKKGVWSSGFVRTKYADGTPAHYKSYIGYQFRLDNSTDEAHLITTRFAPSKSPIRELYWIWIMQSNDVDVLNKLGCKFWNEWKLNDGTIGKAYGYQIAKKTFSYKSQLDYIIGELKNNPNSRRIMTEIWIPNDLEDMALTPCVHLTQWSIINNKLYLEVRQRSCDIALGLVANVFQYSILHKLVALECNLEPADIIYNIHNLHIYDRHYEKLLEQVNRNTYSPAKIKINNFTNIFEFKPEDIEIINYEYGEKIKYEVAI
ncbi:thymidylate synthase [Oceanivirga salmonicida]|uniref:thymidylate synthase n=1 Tax=Oceanivirga salmonicida TaxID=1769291 RepID=UPI00082A2C57|nr:thymidylate synthase [Oceanivirga salmonicida]